MAIRSSNLNRSAQSIQWDGRAISNEEEVVNKLTLKDTTHVQWHKSFIRAKCGHTSLNANPLYINLQHSLYVEWIVLCENNFPFSSANLNLQAIFLPGSLSGSGLYL